MKIGPRNRCSEQHNFRVGLPYADFYSRSHDRVIRVYDDAGNVIETHGIRLHRIHVQRDCSVALCSDWLACGVNWVAKTGSSKGARVSHRSLEERATSAFAPHENFSAGPCCVPE
jgi:hypothetical protein